MVHGIGCTCGLPTRHRRQQTPPLVHGEWGYLLGTAQAPVGANLSAGDALSKALHVTLQHHKRNVSLKTTVAFVARAQHIHMLSALANASVDAQAARDTSLEPYAVLCRGGL